MRRKPRIILRTFRTPIVPGRNEPSPSRTKKRTERYVRSDPKKAEYHMSASHIEKLHSVLGAPTARTFLRGIGVEHSAYMHHIMEKGDHKKIFQLIKVLGPARAAYLIRAMRAAGDPEYAVKLISTRRAGYLRDMSLQPYPDLPIILSKIMSRLIRPRPMLSNLAKRSRD